MDFSLQRVGLLCKKQLAENKQLYILSLLAAAGIVTLVLLYSIFTGHYGLDSGTQSAVLIGGCIITASILASTILNRYTDKNDGVAVLMLPASAAEKLFTALLFGLLIFPLAYLATVYVIIIILHVIDIGPLEHSTSLYKFEGFFKEGIVRIYLLLQALIILFSVVFKRYATIKTIVAMVGLYAGTVYLNDRIVASVISIPKGPPLIHTIHAPRPEDWDKSTYISGKAHRVYYNADGKKEHEEDIKKLVAGTIVHNSPYGRLQLNDELDNPSDNYLNTPKKIPADFSYTLSTWVELSKTTNMLFTILFYLSIPCLWIITWFRLKEIEL